MTSNNVTEGEWEKELSFLLERCHVDEGGMTEGLIDHVALPSEHIKSLFRVILAKRDREYVDIVRQLSDLRKIHNGKNDDGINTLSVVETHNNALEQAMEIVNSKIQSN